MDIKGVDIVKILFINACVRKESRTLLLANELLSGLRGEIEELFLPTLKLQPLDEKMINGRYVDNNYQKYAKQFASADTIVIAAPLWDLSFPSTLKIYIENICIKGITFKFNENGPIGLCRAKRLLYVSTSGGINYPDYGFNYIKALSNTLFGINEVIRFSAEGLDIWGNDVEKILEKTIEEIEEYIEKE